MNTFERLEIAVKEADKLYRLYQLRMDMLRKRIAKGE